MSQQVSPYKLQLQKDKDPADTPAPPSSAKKP
jgi:hypothetical protein